MTLTWKTNTVSTRRQSQKRPAWVAYMKMGAATREATVSASTSVSNEPGHMQAVQHCTQLFAEQRNTHTRAVMSTMLHALTLFGKQKPVHLTVEAGAGLDVQLLCLCTMHTHLCGL